MMDLAHNLADPTGIALDELRRVVQALRLGEQVVDLVDAVLGRMLQNAGLHAAAALGVADDGLDGIVAQGLGGALLGLGVKDIVLHLFVLLFGIVIGIDTTIQKEEEIQNG